MKISNQFMAQAYCLSNSTKLLTEFETLGVMGENDSGIIIILYNMTAKKKSYFGITVKSTHVYRKKTPEETIYVYF